MRNIYGYLMVKNTQKQKPCHCVGQRLSQKTRYTEDEKSHKKLRYAAWYNNAVLYMMLDMPEKAAEEARGLIANDYDAKDGEKLVEQAEALKALLALNKTNTRHFRK